MNRLCSFFVVMLDTCRLDGSSMKRHVLGSSEEGEEGSGVSGGILEGGVAVYLRTRNIEGGERMVWGKGFRSERRGAGPDVGQVRWGVEGGEGAWGG